MKLDDALNGIKPLDSRIMEETQIILDSLTKPLGSLGRLEQLIVKIAGIYGNTKPKIDRKNVVIMCADNGIYEEGVSSCPKQVTASVTRNFLKGITGINVLTRHAAADITVVDIGVDDEIDTEGVIDRKIRKGSWNIAKGPAMTREESIKAIEAGIDIVGDLKEKGYNLLGTGEMGICNTSTSSAMSSVLTGASVETMVGRGSGLSNEGLENKIRVIKRAIEINKANPEDPLDVLAKLGGFDIAGLVGCFIGAAYHRIPILMDGFISATAALTAIRMKPETKDFIFPSHGSAEPGTKTVMESIGMRPYLDLEMRLGEGTGAAVAFLVFDAAFAAYYGMGTFDDANIEQYVPLS
jgi:nicotinate-nucleotide--dimethylbenzimidazole phosphoribosyltransferase